MNREAFKLRMQSLKSYREQNPGKGYWDWRDNLPDNLKYTDDTEYDMEAAYDSGAQPEYVEEDNLYHLPTRDPDTGKIFKKSIHSTFWKGLTEDMKLGYKPYFIGDDVYTKNKQEAPILAFIDGGEHTDHVVDKPIIPQRVERIVNGKPWSLLTAKELFMNRVGYSNGRPLEQGLEIVSPEFDILTGVRGLMQLDLADTYKLSRALKIKKGQVDKVSLRFRNSEWSNFLSSENGDFYYRMGKGTEISNRDLDAQFFVSHTTPWEEFSGLGTSEPMGIKELYKFPTETFGVRKATDYKGVASDLDVTDLGRKHLLYGNTSSGTRGKVLLLSEDNAKLIGMDSPYDIGIPERPLLKNGYYDKTPLYESIHLGNQTTIPKKELQDALLNSTYNKYEYDPNIGIIKTINIGNYL